MTPEHEEAVMLAIDIVQHLADSEPTERSMDGMELLRGTACESMFVLDGDTIRDAIALMIENALTDSVLVTAAKSAALIADVRRKRTDEICSLIRPMLPIGDVSTEYATGHAHAIYEAENLIRARLEEK